LVAEWKALGSTVRLALNLSARDLEDDALPERIEALLERYQLPTSSILLEITESAVMSEPTAAVAILNTLAGKGIDLAIDDFGVGQSSFAYLRQLPVRELKIDQAFVRGMAGSPQDRLIVRSITDLGHNLGYRVTAEGVENAQSLDYLKSIGCDYAQGYFIAKPLPVDEFLEFVQTRSRAACD
jgi:EAL domain-containing protein (putative c-di-GMP-specific phosphodiesterase class I)